LAALALIVITIYLRNQGGMKYMVSAIPAVFMLVMTFWGTILNEINFINQGNGLLIVINSLVILIVIAIAIEGLRKFFVIGKEPVGEMA
jgi:carbon starvation protein